MFDKILVRCIHGKRFTPFARDEIMQVTVRKQTDIILSNLIDVQNPFYINVTIVRQQSNSKLTPRVKLAKSGHIDCCEDLEENIVTMVERTPTVN